MKKEISVLKELIEMNGPDYLSEEPYEVYQNLLEEKADPVLSGMILYTLVSGIAEKAESVNRDELSSLIQKKCFLKKKQTDQMADLYSSLFSEENLRQWKAKEGYGLKEFREQPWNFQWDCEKEWHQGDGYVECTCAVTAEFQVEDASVLKERFHKDLQENSFLTAEEIGDHLKTDLSEMLDDDVDEFVNADDYYEPWMEDYDCEVILSVFAEKYGLKLIDYSCDGDTSDWKSD